LLKAKGIERGYYEDREKKIEASTPQEAIHLYVESMKAPYDMDWCGIKKGQFTWLMLSEIPLIKACQVDYFEGEGYQYSCPYCMKIFHSPDEIADHECF
jgi:hypothetical protein